jgi:hypothetical protein
MRATTHVSVAFLKSCFQRRWAFEDPGETKLVYRGFPGKLAESLQHIISEGLPIGRDSIQAQQRVHNFKPITVQCTQSILELLNGSFQSLVTLGSW